MPALLLMLSIMLDSLVARLLPGHEAKLDHVMYNMHAQWVQHCLTDNASMCYYMLEGADKPGTHYIMPGQFTDA